MASKIPFTYELRPSKQIERKMIIETLNELRFFKYPISSYRYIGMPSITYYDFILFHKYLYITDMIGFESRAIPDRMDFNKPYDFIKIKSGNFSSEYRPTHFNKKSILWLDYERSIGKNQLDDIGDITGNYFKAGSIIIVTSPVDYPGMDDDKIRALQTKLEEFGDFLIYDTEISDFSQITGKNLFLIYYRATKAKIDDSLRSSRLKGLPLFNITYNDGGCPMFSCGFLIDYERKLEKVSTFLTRKKNPLFPHTENGFQIDIPTLTMKERKLFDQRRTKINQDLDAGISLKNIVQLELDDEEFRKYIKHSRHYPSYHEGII